MGKLELRRLAARHQDFASEATMGNAPKPLHLVPAGVQDLPSDLGKSVTKSHLVNRLNYLNFHDKTVMVGLRHLCYDNAITVRARPLPCAGGRLDCSWAKVPSLRQLLKNYRIKRHQSSGIAVQLSQHGALFHGEVLDFTPVALRAQAVAEAPETYYWINREHH